MWTKIKLPAAAAILFGSMGLFIVRPILARVTADTASAGQTAAETQPAADATLATAAQNSGGETTAGPAQIAAPKLSIRGGEDDSLSGGGEGGDDSYVSSQANQGANRLGSEMDD